MLFRFEDDEGESGVGVPSFEESFAGVVGEDKSEAFVDASDDFE